MPVGPQEQQLLELLAGAAQEPGTPIELAPLREGYEGLAAMLPPGPDVGVEDLRVEGPTGPVGTRVYTPRDRDPLGVLVYLHGGGWTIGSLDTHDHPCRTLCDAAGVVVVSVDYRLAPENPYPAALDDARAVLEWVAAERGRWGADSMPIGVGGDSGGGNLAAVLALMARDEGGPDLAFQLLVYPVVDLRTEADDRYPSRRENGSGYVLTLDHMLFFVGNYRPDPTLAEDWHLSPILAASHRDLPPALVITAGYDPLRDEGAAYAAALEDAGVSVTHSSYPDTVHTMYQLAPFLDAGAQALDESAAALRAAFSAPDR